MSSHPDPRQLDATGDVGTSPQAQSMRRRITDGVISGAATNLRVSLELVAQRPASRSYVIRNAGTTMTRTTSERHRCHQGIPTSELDWSPAQAKAVRQGLSSWAEDWDDPALEAYNLHLQG